MGRRGCSIMSVSEQLASIRERIHAAAERSGRDPGAVRLIAVTKTRTADEVREALREGVEDIGENRVQEAEDKRSLLPSEKAVWHLVGHLQGNKASRAVRLFDLIHSVDSADLAARLSRFAAEAEKTQRVLVQVDLAGEATKSGVPASELFSTLERMRSLSCLRVEGLMLLPPFFEEPESARAYFTRLRELAKDAHAKGLLEAENLSMGMSHDFEVAIEEGATMVRIGAGIFGPRESTASL